jgi:Predicted transcriptional regulators
MISEAAKRVEVESHVLRYWQEQLDLPISRNEMDQRYYKESDVELLKKVKLKKSQGYGLKAIKMLIDSGKIDSDVDIQDNETAKSEIKEDKEIEMFQEDKLSENQEGTSLITEESGHEIKPQAGTKMEQFKTIMNHIILDALKENNVTLTEDINSHVTENVVREMNYLMRVQEEKEEERYKKFDTTLREYQKSRVMAAAALDKNRKKSKFFKKNKVKI